jgi:hypothetical protein
MSPFPRIAILRYCMASYGLSWPGNATQLQNYNKFQWRENPVALRLFGDGFMIAEAAQSSPRGNGSIVSTWSPYRVDLNKRSCTRRMAKLRMPTSRTLGERASISNCPLHYSV